MIQLSNKDLSIRINEKGAELQSINYYGLEYLWQADAKYWAKHSPVLFPIVGELKDGKYFYEDREYVLSRHGFARYKVFDVEKISDTSAIFTLHSDDETLSVYPFKFIFQLRYEINDDELSCTYIVKNTGDVTMYFSVGGHPAFRVPLNDKLEYNNYSLKFDDDTKLNRYILHDGLTGDSVQALPLDNHELHLDPSLFYADAIVLKDLKSPQVKLHSAKDPHGLTFHMEGFPYFGIWAANDAPFVCLEPWCGIADSIHSDGQLIHKEGINQLAAEESWKRTWRVKLF
ncbi:MAG TPA: aldose 1-epimerase family protein [Hanamia sp.]